MNDRRAFLVSAAGAAAASTAASSLAQTPFPATRVAGLAPVTKFVSKDLRSLRNEVIAALPPDSSDVREWMKTFDTSLDQYAVNALKVAGQQWIGVAAVGAPLYDPLLIEANLSSASGLLDEALSFRNELASLEIAGFNAGLQYLQGLQALALAEQLVLASSQKQSADELATAYGNAATMVSIGDGLEKRRTAGEAVAVKALSRREAEREKIAANQFELARNALAAQRRQMLQKGSGNNYSERYLRMLPYFLESVGEAYQRCYAAWLGFPYVYGKDIAECVLFTTDSSNELIVAWAKNQFDASPYRKVIAQAVGASAGDVLDALVAWCRSAIEKIETIARGEIEYTVLIPLRQPSLIPAVGAARKSVLNTTFESGVDGGGTGLFTFDLPLSLLTEDFAAEGFSLERMRLTGVGLQVSVKEAEEKFSPVYSASITIAAPTLARVSKFKRPPVVIGRIEGSQSGRTNEAVLVATQAVHNLKPDTKWTIRIRPRVARARTIDAASSSREQISEVLLAVRIRGAIVNF